ncbi:MAG: T9SS type A sorting domain-containing protein [Bacteroidia bacterium]
MNTELKNKLKTYASFTAGATLIATNIDAQIVHTNVNHTIAPSDTYSLDIDGNGISDFKFYNSTLNNITGTYCSYFSWGDFPNLDYGYFLVGGAGELVRSIAPGDVISPSTYGFGLFGIFFSYGVGFIYCPSLGTYISYNNLYDPYSFRKGTDKYIGVKFDISGQTHYGWVRVNIESIMDIGTRTHINRFDIIDMAYETTPNTAISTAAMFLAPPPATAPTAIVNGGNIDFTFDASTAEEAVNDYRLFVVKEGTTFGLAEAETNSNYVSITPDGSANYAHTFTTGTVDSDGNTVLRTSPILDVSGEPLAANQNYNIYVLNMAKTPYATQNSLSTPSNTFTITTVGLNEKSKNVNAFYSNGRLNINIDNTLVGADIKLYNTLGQIVLENKLNNFSNSFNLNQSEGMYIINIQKGDAFISKKILVK